MATSCDYWLVLLSVIVAIIAIYVALDLASRVAAVGDVRQAVKEASRLAPRIVLMDVAVPVLDGIEATCAIVESSPQTAVIMLSDHDSSSTERKVLRLMVNGKSNAEMAAALSLSPRTVETCRSRMMRKFDIKDLPALVTLLH